jgi:acetyltransferase-like isoleucine patch superfamily enzyme
MGVSMIELLKKVSSMVRRHSRLVNLARNAVHLMRNRRVAPGAWLVVDGTLRFGRRAMVSSGCRLTVPAEGVLVLAERVWLNRGVEIDVLRSVTVGAFTTLQRDCTLIGDIDIGRGCVFARNVFISSGRHYFEAWPALPIRLQDARVDADPLLRERHSAGVRIGDDCWLGANVVVLPGITIGRGAIVGANAVVARDVPPYEIVGGVPAQRLRSRFEFLPPRCLDGMCASHLPYFYSGFEFGDSLPPVADGTFVLALALDGARAVRLKFRNLGSPGVAVACGRVSALVPPNDTLEIEVPVDLVGDRDRLQVTLPAGGRIAVLQVVVVDTDAAK